jgi:hypothetical protein
MAKRILKSASSNRDGSLGAGAGSESAERREVRQTVGSAQGTARAAIAESDRAAAAIPDSERAEHDARDRIAARAYELYLQRGGGHGRDTDDWLAAEREVGHRSDRPNDE